MKVVITEQEAMNILSRISQEELELGISGKFKKWNIEKNYSECGSEGYLLEYIHTDKGDLKSKFVKSEDSNCEDSE